MITSFLKVEMVAAQLVLLKLVTLALQEHQQPLQCVLISVEMAKSTRHPPTGVMTETISVEMVAAQLVK